MRTVVLRADDVFRVVQAVGLDTLMDRMIERLASAIRAFDRRHIHVPPRSGFEYSNPRPGLLEWMPAVCFGRQAMIKVVGYHPTNPKTHGLPTILSTICIYDTTTGHLEGVVDGTLLTAIRTGAASAVASSILAREGTGTLGLIGCGAQAVTQLHALSRVFDIQKVMFYDTDPQAVATFPSRASFREGRSVELSPALVQDIVRESDIICTATSVGIGEGPVFEYVVSKPWLHINAIGSDFPGKTEVPLSFLKNSLVCPDFLDQAIHEGECQQLEPQDIGPDLVGLLHQQDHHKHSSDRTTVFDSTGWALEDYIAAEVFIGYAEQLGLGRSMQIECITEDPKDPYGLLRHGLGQASIGPDPLLHQRASEAFVS